MCGIVGYVGERQAAPLVLDGLKRLEYRGYDSAGLAVIDEGRLTIHRAAGRIDNLLATLKPNVPGGRLALGHTRWATHGEPNETNAHPHIDCGGILALVHNGIIENASTLRAALTKRGHTFRSQTDTEVLVHLIEQLYDRSLQKAVAAALQQVEGAYGVAVISTREPGLIVAARHGSPLLLGVGDGENFVGSDAAALIEHTRSVVYLDDGEIVALTADSYDITDRDTTPVAKLVDKVEWDLETIERSGYPHFMLKEFMQQPSSVCDTLRGRLLEDAGSARLSGLR